MGPLIETISAMPSIPDNSDKYKEYNVQWQQWKLAAKAAINQVQQWPPSAQTRHVQNTLEMLIGSEKTIAAHAETDIEAYISAIFYAHPLATMEEVFDTNKRLSVLFAKGPYYPTIISQLLRGDLYGALENCWSMDWWLLAHFTDLLRLSPLYSNLLPALQFTGREGQYIQARMWFALNYANYLLKYDITRNCAFEYMITCGDRGRTMLVESVKQIPLGDKIALELLQHYYEQGGMKDAANRFFEILAVRSIEEKDFLGALHYYCLSNNRVKVEHTFELALVDYAESGQLAELDSLKDKYDPLLNGERAQFFFQFAEMRKLYMSNKKQEASAALRQLLIAETSPLEFLPIVFLEGLCLLEDGSLWFNAEDIEHFKACIQDLEDTDAEEGYSVLEKYMIQRDYESTANIRTVKSTFIDMIRLTLDRYPVS
ncbi:Nuclear pore complex protein Nup85 [Apophysomyces ossiformis]|uniref:Nuclear pore complex protein Nup85 n=1 Tax=Apophysomyces ossiformis TaxID=679940 RepID=A0A8H7ESU7_9FUNG|nr:Nuclear pore complex protein Nup85 [Apophysomyces ossiformis]